MRDAFSDRKLLRRSSKFFLRLRKILRLGSSITLSYGATHIVVSRKLVTRCAHAPPDPSLSLLRWSYSYIGLFLALFLFFYFFVQCILFLLNGCFFIFYASSKQIASSCFLILKNFKTADQLFCARHARRFARGRRQFVASSSFNPFPLDRLLGRPTPPWVP